MAMATWQAAGFGGRQTIRADGCLLFSCGNCPAKFAFPQQVERKRSHRHLPAHKALRPPD